MIWDRTDLFWTSGYSPSPNLDIFFNHQDVLPHCFKTIKIQSLFTAQVAVGKSHLVDMYPVCAATLSIKQPGEQTPKVKLLIEYGARLDLVDVGPMENTALHLAARFGAVPRPMLKVLGGSVQSLSA